MKSGELLEIGGQLLPEIFQPRPTGKRFIHAKTSDHDRRGPAAQERLHVFFIPFRAQPVADLVARPRETSKPKVFLRLCQLNHGFQFSVLTEAFDHGIAVADNGISRVQ